MWAKVYKKIYISKRIYGLVRADASNFFVKVIIPRCP
jgi:hypothetical protein